MDFFNLKGIYLCELQKTEFKLEEYQYISCEARAHIDQL